MITWNDFKSIVDLPEGVDLLLVEPEGVHLLHVYSHGKNEYFFDREWVKADKLVAHAWAWSHWSEINSPDKKIFPNIEEELGLLAVTQIDHRYKAKLIGSHKTVEAYTDSILESLLELEGKLEA